MKYAEVQNCIGGAFVSPDAHLLDVHDPSSGGVISRVPLSSGREVDAAVAAAQAAFPGWAGTPIKERVQVLYRYKTLLETHIDELSALVTEENGKIATEARAEVLKSAELTEFACSLPQIVTGEVLEVSRGVECRVERYPVGVVASITPFNFPNMVPNWTIPNAIALGNCMILKPSELVPLSARRIVELLQEAGLPTGVLQVVHGGREAVEALCDHPAIGAVSFVGSTKVAQIVYRRATSNLKRCLALGGAKNHLIVMPDADREMAASNIVASMSGCAGQRCMAASVMVAVSATDHIIARMAEHARAMVPGRDVGPVISAAARERIIRYIDEAEAAGATVVVDGRHVSVRGREGGYYIGPTILDHVTPDMRIAQEEVFGPVLSVLRYSDDDDAVRIANNSQYGLSGAVWGTDVDRAVAVARRIRTGQIAVNGFGPGGAPFGGFKQSGFGRESGGIIGIRQYMEPKAMGLPA
jgi:malonate-semialdehyde dehydrogenase (acetylating)/methylmalonate-semialdehyde dehydrogenase